MTKNQNGILRKEKTYSNLRPSRYAAGNKNSKEKIKNKSFSLFSRICIYIYTVLTYKTESRQISESTKSWYEGCRPPIVANERFMYKPFYGFGRGDKKIWISRSTGWENSVWNTLLVTIENQFGWNFECEVSLLRSWKVITNFSPCRFILNWKICFRESLLQIHTAIVNWC